MKSISLKQTTKEPHLKVVNNTIGKYVETELINRIYINTLVPNFNFVNSKKELITPKKCALL